MGLDAENRRGAQGAAFLVITFAVFIAGILLEAIWGASWRWMVTTFILWLVAMTGVVTWALFPRSPQTNLAGLINWPSNSAQRPRTVVAEREE